MSYIYEELFRLSSIPKNLILEFDNGEVFDNDKLFSESLELTESICSGQQLTFGSVEANCFKVTLSDTFKSHKNLWFNAYFVLNNDNDTKYQIGRYYVVDDKAQADHSKRRIVAYDNLYHIINTDVTNWYNGLTFPISLKLFRKSFCDYLGISEIDVDLVNDSMLIEKTIEPDKLSGADVLCSYSELNGVFPNIDRNGDLEYILLPTYILEDELFPKNDLFPDNNIFPVNSNAKIINRSLYQSCNYDEFVTNKISKLQIRESENDIGAISGTGNNCYIIEDNFLVYGKSADDLKVIADNLYNLISQYMSYRPFNTLCIGNPELKLGEAVRINTRYEIITSVVLKRVLKGIQGLKDTISAQGIENYAEIVNDVNTSILQLKGKSNVLERTVEKTQQTIRDVEKGLQSQITITADSLISEITRATTAEGTLSSKITQNENSIKTKVTKGDVSSEISQEPDKITITGNRFVLSSTNCSISEDGTITASNVDLNGRIKTVNNNIYSKLISGKLSFGEIKNGQENEIGYISSLIEDISALSIYSSFDITLRAIQLDAKNCNQVYLPSYTYVGTIPDKLIGSTEISNTYLSKTDASLTYLSSTNASITYLSKTDASNTYLSKTDASNSYMTKPLSTYTGNISYVKDSYGNTGQLTVNNGIITFAY